MSLEDDVHNLARTATLGELEADALRLIAFSAETRILRTGEVLFHEGDVSDGGYVVLKGAITLETRTGASHDVGPFTLIGDVALLTETCRPATATARSATSVLKISRALFRRVLGEYPASADALRRALKSRVAALQGELRALHAVMT